MKDNGQVGGIRLVIFDWAGTAVDFGCFAPVRPFMEALGAVGVEISTSQARGPMGLSKRDHFQALFELPDVRRQWRDRHQRDWTSADVDDAFTNHFMPLQMKCVEECTGLVPGLLETMTALHARGIKVGTSTGYFREAADLAFETGRKQGYCPDSNTCPADVSAGRPAPWMIFLNMERTGVYPASAVVKVGDTIPDVREGLNAGTWVIGVTDSSSEIGMTLEEFEALADSEREARTSAWGERLRGAGAHDVIATVADLIPALDRIEERLQKGELPLDSAPRRSATAAGTRA